MTPLLEKLIRQITHFGPITVADYMTTCLLHPEHGYYTTGTPLGGQGDFITAPEISQMFGELIGLWLAQTWLDQGQPSPFILVELGPGRGTLMQDALRATRSVPGFHNTMQLHLIDQSAPLRKLQSQTLQDFNPHWTATLADLPDLPMFLVANEFFDCLPIRQFARQGNGWSERLIAAHNNALAFTAGPRLPAQALGIAPMPEATTCEQAIGTAQLMQHLSHHIVTLGGAALIIDYGDWHVMGDTFQAVKNHLKTDPLLEPGQADLTAHVSFSQIAKYATPDIHVSKMLSQGEFLEALGITHRAQTLAKNLSGQALENHILAHRRLTHPKEMGKLFKTLALTPKTAPLPPGFAS